MKNKIKFLRVEDFKSNSVRCASQCGGPFVD